VLCCVVLCFVLLCCVVFCLHGQEHSASGGRADRVLPYRSAIGCVFMCAAFSCRCLHGKLM
jgi:hypothetical protein